MSGGGTDNKVKLVFGFAEADALLFRELDRHLAALKGAGGIEVWHAGDIQPGEDRHAELTRHFAEADLIVLFLSADFLSAPECYELELKLALTRQSSGKGRLIPILVRPVDLSGAPLEGIKLLPENGQPISQRTDRDQAWMEIARHLRAVIHDIRPEAGTARAPRAGVRERAREIYLRRRGLLIAFAALVAVPIGATAVLKIVRSASVAEERQAVAESISRDSLMVDKRLSSLMTTFESFLKDAPGESDALAAAQRDLKRAIDEQYRQFDEHAWFWYSGLASKAARLRLPPPDQKKIHDCAEEYRLNLIASMRAIDPSWGLLLSQGITLRAPYTIATVGESRAALSRLTAQRGAIAQCLRQPFLGSQAR